MGRHQFAGLRNTGSALVHNAARPIHPMLDCPSQIDLRRDGWQAQVEIPPTVVSTGRLLLTVGGTGGVRAGVIGDRA